MTKWFDTNYHYLVPELERDQRFALRPVALDRRRCGRPRALGHRDPPGGPRARSASCCSRRAGDARSRCSTRSCRSTRSCSRELRGGRRARGPARRAVPRRSIATAPSSTRSPTRARAARRTARRPTLCWRRTSRAPRPDARALALPGSPSCTSTSCAHPSSSQRRSPRSDAHAPLARRRRRPQRLAHRPRRARSTGSTRRAALGTERVTIAPSCSLLHVPVDARARDGIDPELRAWLAFADEKLGELRTARARPRAATSAATSCSPRPRRRSRAPRPRRVTNDRAVRAPRGRARRRTTTTARAVRDAARPRSARGSRCPTLPTTTIGSFPQTAEIRAARAAACARGELDRRRLRAFLRARDRRRSSRAGGSSASTCSCTASPSATTWSSTSASSCAGFAFTEHGWVQSYGSRCVKPPILYGDVSRPAPMTVDWWQLRAVADRASR